jgi:hypothetical protein
MPPKNSKVKSSQANAAKAAKATVREEGKASHQALFNPKRAATTVPAASTPASKKPALGRPPGSADSMKRVAPDAATVAEGAAHGSGGGPRSRAPAGQFIPEETRKSRAVGELRDRHSQGVEQSRSLSTDIETKLQGMAVGDAESIAACALLLCSEQTSGGDIDSAAQRFCESDERASEIEQLHAELREKNALLEQQGEQIAELEAGLDDRECSGITSK